MLQNVRNARVAKLTGLMHFIQGLGLRERFFAGCAREKSFNCVSPTTLRINSALYRNIKDQSYRQNEALFSSRWLWGPPVKIFSD